MFDIDNALKTLPAKPGVYLHKDETGEIIYVGKASSLKSRVRQYFTPSGQINPKVKAMVSHISEFEYIVTDTEVEALILENNLIKRYSPKYNVLLRDDKTYPYIEITLGEEYPRLLKTRNLSNESSKYFGPYADVKSVNTVIDLLNDVFKLKRCNTTKFPPGFRPCLNGHINKCRMICQGNIDRSEYMKSIDAIESFLKGKNNDVLKYLEGIMKDASDNMDFEQAATYRDYLASAKTIMEKQRVELLSSGDMDIVVASFKDIAEDSEQDSNAQITVFFVRDGKLTGREIHHLRATDDDTKEDIVSAFLKQYYLSRSMIPKEILLESMISDAQLVEESLSEAAEHKVKLHVPQRGDKKALLALAVKDVEETKKAIDQRVKKRQMKDKQLKSEIVEIFNNDEFQNKNLRFEAYDISNTGGADTVGAMVVFTDTKPLKKAYRKFKIRTDEGNDDYASMQEVLYRRLKRGLDGDKSFLPFPDILLIDGGLGHVNAVRQITDALNMTIPIAGMVKNDKHRTRGLIVNEKEYDLKEYPSLYHLVGQIQEEVHRFVIDYHRSKRNKNAVVSELDGIKDVGEKRRNALMVHFKTLDNIRQADIKELEEVPGINNTAAKNIYYHFHINKDSE